MNRKHSIVGLSLCIVVIVIVQVVMKKTFSGEQAERERSVNEVKPNGQKQSPFTLTTCSERSFKRGTGQKVISFAFYGDIETNKSKAKGYFEGIKDNLKLISKHYPGFLMRVYVDLDSADPVLANLRKLENSNTNLDICDVKALPGTPLFDATRVFAMVWRFFPTLDPQVGNFYLSK